MVCDAELGDKGGVGGGEPWLDRLCDSSRLFVDVPEVSEVVDADAAELEGLCASVEFVEA